MKKVLVSLVTMTGLVFAQQSPSLDSVISAIEQAAKSASAPEMTNNATTSPDVAALGANAKEGDKKSAVKTATIVSGAAALGAVVGAAASKDNRSKGALIGAAVGGAAGYLIERMIRNSDKESASDAEKPAVVEKPNPVQKPDLEKQQFAAPH